MQHSRNHSLAAITIWAILFFVPGAVRAACLSTEDAQTRLLEPLIHREPFKALKQIQSKIDLLTK